MPWSFTCRFARYSTPLSAGSTSRHSAMRWLSFSPSASAMQVTSRATLTGLMGRSSVAVPPSARAQMASPTNAGAGRVSGTGRGPATHVPHTNRNVR